MARSPARNHNHLEVHCHQQQPNRREVLMGGIVAFISSLSRYSLLRYKLE